MNRTSSYGWHLSVWMLLISGFVVRPVLANPTGENIAAGSASFERNGSTLQITTSDRAIINWQDFSIGSGELTRFIQPSSTSAALNRVISGNPSSILGTLQANGQIHLINPNGILVGGGAVINCSSFIASTLDISDRAFMAGGDLNFSGSSTAAIQNFGSISAMGGDIFLIAQRVENMGRISASDGVAGIAAGYEVLLRQAGDERLAVQLGTRNTERGTGIMNVGVIEAARAELKAAGGNMYALAINNTGVIRATGAVEKVGRVYLVANGGNIENSGTIVAQNINGDGGYVRVDGGRGTDGNLSTVIDSGTILARGNAIGLKGGTVELLGDRVGVLGFAEIDVSGDGGGGTVLIGGDFQGKNAEIQNAWITGIGKDVKINADAITEGNGGKVIVWADGITRYNGTITARGGSRGGDGGLVEVSGKEFLSFNGAVDTFAQNGNIGSVLLDPADLTITDATNTTGDQDGTLTGANQILSGDADIGGNTVSWGPLIVWR